MMLHSANATVRQIHCTGLNETRLAAAAPDLLRPARAYGLSDAGELVGLALAGQNRISACRVRLRRQFGAQLPRPRMAVLPSGAAVTDSGRLHLFNTTGSAKDGKRTVLQLQLSQLPGCVSGTCKYKRKHLKRNTSTVHFVLTSYQDLYSSAFLGAKDSVCGTRVCVAWSMGLPAGTPTSVCGLWRMHVAHACGACIWRVHVALCTSSQVSCVCGQCHSLAAEPADA